MFNSAHKALISQVIIKIAKNHVKQSKYMKFLGLLVDEYLSWKSHLNELSKILARTCALFLN